MKENKSNIYEIGYNLYDMIDEIYPEHGIKKQIKYVKKVLKADDILLLKKDDDNDKYETLYSNNEIYLNELKALIKAYNRRRVKDFNIELDGNYIKNLLILNIPVNDKQFVLASTNAIGLDNHKELISVIKKGLRKNLSIVDKMNKLKTAINTDQLTFINNRACFEEDKIKLLNNKRKIITFIMADLFRLKHINDTYGHNYGDKYIINTAKVLVDVFNDEKAKVYRLSGDEFAIIIEGYDIIDLEEKVAIAQQKVANLDLGVDNERTMINMGIAVGPARDIDKIYESADKHMNDNKQNMYKILKVNRT